MNWSVFFGVLGAFCFIAIPRGIKASRELFAEGKDNAGHAGVVVVILLIIGTAYFFGRAFA